MVKVPIKFSSVRPDRERVEVRFSKPSRTRQEFAEECDINSIMARYSKTGVISHVNPAEPRFLDLSVLPDFQSAMHIMMQANDAFASLPAAVRREFDNDPAKFVSFAEDGANLPKLREWGLAPPEKVPEPPQRVEVVNAPAPARDPSTGS